MFFFFQDHDLHFGQPLAFLVTVAGQNVLQVLPYQEVLYLILFNNKIVHHHTDYQSLLMDFGLIAIYFWPLQTA
jgi:hypothetical protein